MNKHKALFVGQNSRHCPFNFHLLLLSSPIFIALPFLVSRYSISDILISDLTVNQHRDLRGESNNSS